MQINDGSLALRPCLASHKKGPPRRTQNKKGADLSQRLSSNQVALLRTRQRGMRQRGFIREAEGAIDRVGGCSHLKPLQ